MFFCGTKKELPPQILDPENRCSEWKEIKVKVKAILYGQNWVYQLFAQKEFLM